MKPNVQDEMEDDLAAEEENKLINEVGTSIASPSKRGSNNSTGFLGIQNMVFVTELEARSTMFTH